MGLAGVLVGVWIALLLRSILRKLTEIYGRLLKMSEHAGLVE